MYQPKGRVSYREETKTNCTTGKKWLFYPYTNHSTFISTKTHCYIVFPPSPEYLQNICYIDCNFQTSLRGAGPPPPFPLWTIFHSCHPSQGKNENKCGKQWKPSWILFSCIFIKHRSFYGIVPTAGLKQVLIDLSALHLSSWMMLSAVECIMCYSDVCISLAWVMTIYFSWWLKRNFKDYK